MSTTDTTPSADSGMTKTPATPSVDTAVTAVLSGFAAICGAPDDREITAAANAALRDLDLLVEPDRSR